MEVSGGVSDPDWAVSGTEKETTSELKAGVTGPGKGGLWGRLGCAESAVGQVEVTACRKAERGT